MFIRMKIGIQWFQRLSNYRTGRDVCSTRGEFGMTLLNVGIDFEEFKVGFEPLLFYLIVPGGVEMRELISEHLMPG